MKLQSFSSILLLVAMALSQPPAQAGDAKKEKKSGGKFVPEETMTEEGAVKEPFKTIGDTTLNVWIYQPENAEKGDKRPAFVFFYGGGWNGRNISQFHPHALYVAERGMVCVIADYRSNTTYGGTPFDCVADAKSAIRWVRANADRLGIDPGRIVAGGGSAGGHLAAATGNLPGLDDEADDQSISATPNCRERSMTGFARRRIVDLRKRRPSIPFGNWRG